MDNNPLSAGGRRRKIDPAAKKPEKTNRLSSRIGQGLTAGGRWLSQPLVNLPGSGQQARPVVTALSRQRSLAPRYLREAWAELCQVSWPRFGQAMRLTFAVMLFSAFFAILIANIDQLLTRIFEEIILNESQNIREFLNNIF